jgi:SET domain-containing protein
VPLRLPRHYGTIGWGLDVTTAMVNHSCEPNSFAFLDGSYLHVRSLKKLVPGDEITFCYSETVEDLFTRKESARKRTQD